MKFPFFGGPKKEAVPPPLPETQVTPVDEPVKLEPSPELTELFKKQEEERGNKPASQYHQRPVGHEAAPKPVTNSTGAGKILGEL